MKLLQKLKNFWADSDNRTYAKIAACFIIVVIVLAITVPGYSIFGGLLAVAFWALTCLLYINFQRMLILIFGFIAAVLILMYIH